MNTSVWPPMLKRTYNVQTQLKSFTFQVLSLVHIIWIERQMLKLVLNVKYLLFLSFLTAAEFYNLGHIQGIIRVQ